MATLIHASNLTKRHGLQILFEGVTLTIASDDRLGIIGPNGGGKSTLLKLLAGQETPDAGSVVRSKGLRMAYVAQNDQFDGQSVLDAATLPLVALGHEAHEAELEAMSALSEAGFADFDQPHARLSGGWRKRLSLARALAQDPELLMLDEPTNHLDLSGVRWLQETLGRFKGACVFVSHDRMFLEETAKRMVELSYAYPGGTFGAEGNYSRFLEKREEFLDSQAKQQQALASIVRRDTAWLQRGVKARRTRNKTQVEASAQRRDELAELARRNRGAQTAGIAFQGSDRQTRKLLTATQLGKAMGGRQLFRGLDLILSPGSRVGLLGDNGAGKTTLIRCLSGILTPDSGTVVPAEKLKIVHFSQGRESLAPNQLLRDALQGGTGVGGDRMDYRGQNMHIASWAERFLFDKDQLDTPVYSLSGGEQARVLIARLMLQPADLLILDEPTNDLDIPSLDVLEEALDSFPGAILLVTHDRFMLDRVCDTLLEIGKDAGPLGHAFHYSLDQFETASKSRRAILADTKADERQKQERKAESAAPAPPTTPPAPKSMKLGFKEQFELDNIEKNIHEAEAAAALLEAEALDPKIAAHPAKLTAVYQKLGAAQEKVQALFTRWEELENKAAGR